MRSKLVMHAGLVGLLALFVSGTVLGAQEWGFAGVDRIELEGVSGDVVLLPADGRDGRVELRENVTPRGNLEATVEEHGGTLEIREEWSGRSSRGDVEWTIYLPTGGIEIRINTASGSLRAEEINARIDLSTASGDVTLIDMELERRSELSTASGAYVIEDMTVQADVKLNTASGDIQLSNVELEDEVQISTASGDVECNGCRGQMELSTASGDVRVRNSTIEGHSTFSSASGDVLLDSKDLRGSYTLVLTAREDTGRIVNRFRATSKRTFREGRYTYEEQRVEQGSGGPEIRLRTASGEVRVQD